MAKAFGWRNLLLGTAGAVPLLAGGAAMAAQPPQGATGVGEVVVTATRQAQTLSKVPESVSAFTATKMEMLNIKSVADVAKFTPGLTFDQDRHDVSIRGIDSKAGSGTTGIYIDDTPIQMRALGLNANNTLPAVFDLDRVEVLRGPQGTLFGAGSEGGTVRYITAQPSLTKFSAVAHTEVATTENGALSYEFGAAAGGPIVDDKLGFRVSAWGRRDGGWVTRNNVNDVSQVEKDANRTDTYVLRAALTWAPTKDLTITPSINYEKRDEHNHDEYWVSISNPGSGKYLSGTPDRMADPDRFYLPALKIEWDAGPVKFISNTAYYDRLERVNGYSGTLYNLSYFQHYTTGSAYGAGPSDPWGDPCGTAVCNAGGQLLDANGLSALMAGFGPYVSRNWITNSQQNFTQEFRLQSNDPGARLTWVAGLFYAYNTQRSTEEINDPQLPALTQYLWGESMLDAWGSQLLANGDDYINDTRAHDRQIALFGDATLKVTDALKLTVGVRYAWTHFDFNNVNGGPQDLQCVPIKDGGDPCVTQFAAATGKKDETPLTPKVSLSYQITSDDMVYGTVSKGYRIGGATPPLPSACEGTFPSEYNSDTVLSYEIGTKDRFFDRRLYVSGSIYYVQWSNIQQAIYVPICGIQYTTNVGSAVSQGFDLEGQWQITHAFDLEMSVGYTDAHYTGNAVDKNSGATLALKGDVLDVTPWTITLGAQYNFTIYDHDAFIRADYEFHSRRTRPIPAEDPNSTYYDPGLVPDPATHLVSMRAGVNLGKVDLAVFVDNLLDAHPQLNLQHQDSTTALYEATTFRPRTVGIAASWKF
jgi:iron complex outermembrane receptor protein